MHNFKKIIYPIVFIILILCMNQILMLAVSPYTEFRNDMHKLETNQYDTLYIGTSHGKAGLNPNVIDEITGEKSLNMCLGGEEMLDSYYIVKEACRVNKPQKVVYELDPGYWAMKVALSPEYVTIYDEFPVSNVKAEYYMDKVWGEDFRVTLFPWFLYRKGIKGAKQRLERKLSKEYQEYSDSFYSNDWQKYTEKGQIAISRNTPFNASEDIVLWDRKKMNSEAAEAFEKLVKLCKKEGIELTVVTAPVPQETFEKYKSNFEDADKFFTNYMSEQGVDYYNFNYIDIHGFDRSINGFSDYEGHMYEDQAEIFSKEIAKIVE